ncbi:MAG: GyrI-like domain-containing protein [Paludibacteraceae bacterium]|nr:GyrI-like domain-containing protein [Paludibacteraceae bacterium]MBN2787532.1 GyrI-like domain-containing protein [Paludibacteraceae bacterium]
MEIGSLIAAILPSALFLFLILYYTIWNGNSYVPKVINTNAPLKIVGVSVKTNDASFIEDDTSLWKEFRRVKELNSIPKEDSFNFVLVKMMPAKNEANWDYFIGDIVTNFDNVPSGFKTAELIPGKYVTIRRSFKKEIPWVNETLKIEHFLYEKWLPHSNYELDPNSPIKSIEYHNKRKGSAIRTIIFYAAIKEKLNNPKN